MTPQMVTCAARRYLGVRFAHQGRSAHGLDCLGLLICVAQDLGLRFNALAPAALDSRDYSHQPDTQALQQALATHLCAIAPESAGSGDIVLLRVNGSPQHLAILATYPQPGSLAMIHAYAPARRVVEHRYDRVWQQATHAAYRLPQLDGATA